MATITAVLWKGKKNKKGERPVYLRLEAGDRRQYFSLRIWIEPSRWNPKAQRVRKGHRRADAYNGDIRRAIEKAEDEIDRLRRDGEEVTPALLKAALQPSAKSRFDFLAYGATRAEEFRRLGKIPTHKRYVSILRKLRAYAGNTMPFSRLTLQFLRGYHTYMVGELGNSESTVASNFRAIKALVNRAIKDGLIARDDSPFIHFPVVEPRSTKAKLSLEEIDAITALDLKEGSSIWHARNYFLFSFYTCGARFKDVCFLTVGNVSGGRLQYTMRKTAIPKDIRLVPAARVIREHYNVDERSPGEYLFPLLDKYNLSSADKLHRSVRSRNVVVNRLLKDIAAQAGITPELSFHMSRHSWADYARREGWDVYKTSKALGHTDLKTTENYLRGFDAASFDSAMERLFPEKE